MRVCRSISWMWLVVLASQFACKASTSTSCPEMDCEGTKTSADLKACDATVADLESCGNAILNELASKLRLIDCSNLADIEAVQKKLDGGLNSADLPGCKTLSTMCPDVDLGD